MLKRRDICDDPQCLDYNKEEDMFDWDYKRIDFSEWDLDEDLFKWNLMQLDVLHELEAAAADYEDRMNEIRAVAARMDLHPLELNWVDGIGSMDELIYHKAEVTKSINYIRDRLPVLLNTD